MSWMEEDDSAPWDAGDAEGGEAGAATEASAEGGPAASGDAVAEAPQRPNRPKADPPHYTYHWVRPLFLNYGYLYDYRQNYYNDVIDWMNKRNKGIYREPPRAQEWAERALRTYDEKNLNKSHKHSADMGAITKMKHHGHHYSYHTRAYYSLKYMKIL